MEKSNGNFVHLHVHTMFSLLDGVPASEDLAKKAVELGQPAVAITDHGYMFGCYKHQQACSKAGIKAIHGCEFYYVDDVDNHEDRSNYHLILLAMNETGWRNLIMLNTLAGQKGFYYKPRIDMKMLAAHSDGLIVLSGCYKSPISYHFSVKGRNIDKARANMLMLSGLFKDRFYNEVMMLGWDEYDPIVPEMVDMATSLGVRTVVTNDIHYTNKDDFEIQKTMLKISTAGFGDESGLEFSATSLYMKSREEMVQGAITQQMADATMEIFERIKFELSFSGYKFPSFDIKQSPKFEEFRAYMQERRKVTI